MAIKSVVTPLLLISVVTCVCAQTRVMAGAAPKTPPASVSTVNSADQSGRPKQFTNSVGRIFQVNYDGNGRPSSVLAIGTPNISDVVSIGYDGQGRVAGFTLRSGYTVYYDYGADGIQRIHDRMGGLMVRAPQAGGSYRAVSYTAGAGRLQDFVSAMDSLQSRLVATPAQQAN